MKPTTFKEHNVVYAKDQDPFLPLPAFKDSGATGDVISCWKLTLKERVTLLFTGKIWLSVLTFHKPLHPMFFGVRKRDFFVKNQQNKNLRGQSSNATITGDLELVSKIGEEIVETEITLNQLKSL